MDAVLTKHATAIAAHQQYLDSLKPPTPAEAQWISEVQLHKESEIYQKYHAHSAQEHDAATKIQAAYRGHRARREQLGLTLDPSSRWTDLISELKYRSVTAPHHAKRPKGNGSNERIPSSSDIAKLHWRKAGWIAERAGRGESPNSSPRTTSEISGTESFQSTKDQEDVSSMLMDLRYFLEMVDTKHRYGANLQIYHEYWQRQSTTQNFFYWLDHGPGRHLDLPLCNREKLDRERIRYLTREERKDYLVEVDDEGHLRWAKDGELITTSIDEFKDSAHGIVPIDTPEPVVPGAEDQAPLETTTTIDRDLAKFSHLSLDSDSDEEDDTSSSSSANDKSTSKKQKRPCRVHISPATFLNHLLRSSVKPGTWIYVTDTLGRLYVSIKNSGTFQHASFLSGARIRSAGAIAVENGRLTYLSPLSGHYRPTTKSFRDFLASLDDSGVDLSALKVSGAYKVLRGMEFYGKTKKRLRGTSRAERHEKREQRKHAETVGRKEQIALELVHETEGVSATELVEKHWEKEHAHKKKDSKG